MQKTRISAVSYLNTLPFIYGIEKSEYLGKNIILTKDYPAECSNKLLTGQADLGLIPVAEIIKIENPQITGNYCIGAVGEVKTVLLLSEVPLNKIHKILLDYQSKTSVNLVQVLAKEFWNINPQFQNTSQGFEKNISETTAAVVIGDRTFDIAPNYEYVYDLSQQWTYFTGLPFIFAAWVSSKKLPDEFVSNFNDACKFGVQNINSVVEDFTRNKNGNYSFLKNYLTNDISYLLDNPKMEGMKLFHFFLKKYNLNIK